MNRDASQALDWAALLDEAAGFIARHGRLVQVELDALPPEVLRQLFMGALSDHWDHDAYTTVLAQEPEDRRRLEGRP